MHIGVVSPLGNGHLNPSATLAASLKARGHRVTYISPPSGKSQADHHGLDFYALWPDMHPHLEERFRIFASLKGIEAIRYTMKTNKIMDQLLLRDLPKAFKQLDVDGFLVDEILYLAGSTVGDAMNLPYGTIADALTMSHGLDGPPFITTLVQKDTWLAQFRDWAIWVLILVIAHKNDSFGVQQLNEYRKKHGLPLLENNGARHGGVIQVAQQPAFFEFPKSDLLPDHFFYTSPWHNLGRDCYVPFPWEKINPNKQLVYASLGTMQAKLIDVFKNLCRACKGLDEIQLVLTLGKRDATLDISPDEIPEDCILVDFAPQLELLRKSSIVISHCGMNTCLEVMACGIPAVGIPLTNDQPGVAARWSALGAAYMVDGPKKASPENIRRGLEAILPKDSTYRQAAKELQSKLEETAPSLDTTARLIELAFQSKDPTKQLSRDDPRVEDILASKQVEPLRQNVTTTRIVTTSMTYISTLFLGIILLLWRWSMGGSLLH